MGMRLEGTILKNVVSTNIRSEGIVKGSIQVPADGQPIVLLNDHPTIGGYPKIANVISADYDLLVQNVPGTDLSFKYIELEEAESAFELYSKDIKKIDLYPESLDFDNEKLMDKGNIYEMWSKYVARKE